MAQNTKRGAAISFFREVVDAPSHPIGCVLWPFARKANGYAVFGKKRGEISSSLVARVVCSEVHGQPPSLDYEAAHTCGKGHLGCINPRHLHWKTSKQNKDDQLLHGTRNYGERNGRSRLTVEQIVQIRELGKRVPQSAVAKAFGIDPSTVSDIINRHRWGHVQ